MSDLKERTKEIQAGPKGRHRTVQVTVGNVKVGGGAPIVVQSMTNTDTADIEGTVKQVAALARAGSEMVRITVDRDEAAGAVPPIREKLAKLGIDGALAPIAAIAKANELLGIEAGQGPLAAQVAAILTQIVG